MLLLSSERLVLRGLQQRDAPALLALYGDSEVMRYWNHAPWTSPAQAVAAIREAQDDYLHQRSLHLAIEHRRSGALLGSCALYAFAGPDPYPDHDLDPDRPAHRPLPWRWRAPRAMSATLGYLLARPHWGRGYAAEALQALLAHGFSALRLQQVRAEVASGNDASR